MRRLKGRRGQATLEMAILWTVVVIGLVYMVSFFGRHVKGYVRNQASSVSDDPWGNSAVYLSNSTSNSTSNSDSIQTKSNSLSNSNTKLTLNAVP